MGPEEEKVDGLGDSELGELVRFAKNLANAKPDSTAFAADSTTPDSSLEVKVAEGVVPPSIDRYEFLERIGQGAMGIVWKARQTHPVERELAIKVGRSRAVSDELSQRLEVERQALAMMEHPGIARMFDAGTTEEGQPYFAMELIDGTRFERFCDEQQFSIRSRLQLFLQVCEAVQHAHQKGVIHRDLKPSNILVGYESGSPVAKVIDFGLAKSLEHLPTFKDGETAFGQVLGTIHYMSPEQANSDSLRIDSRTDIYSLGAMLYELLCGVTPLSNKISSTTPLQEAVRKISEVHPISPSRRIGDLSDSDSCFANRDIGASSLKGILSGELDWLAMKAIEKDPAQRYQTVSELASDIKRFLCGEPVLARPTSLKYRFSKFVRKHRILVTAGSLLVLSMITGVVGTSVGWSKAIASQKLANERFRESEDARLAEQKAKVAEAERAESEREAKEHAEQLLSQTSDYNDILRTIFRDLDPSSMQSEQASAPLERRLADKLIEAGDQIAKNNYDKPKLQLQLLSDLGTTIMNLGYPVEAVALFERAVEVVDENEDDDRLGWIGYSAVGLAKALLANGNSEEASVLYQRALQVYVERNGPEHGNTLAAKHGLAAAQLEAGNVDNAIQHLEELLPLRVQALGANHKGTLTSMNVLALAYSKDFQLDKSREMMTRILEARRKTLGKDAVGTIITMSNLADVHHQLGAIDDAIRLQEKTLAFFQEKLGEKHQNTLAVQVKLASCYRTVGNNDDAMQLVESAIPLLSERLGNANRRTTNAITLLATLLLDENQPIEAVELLEEIYANSKKELGESSYDTLDIGYHFAFALDLAGEAEMALDLGGEVYEACQSEFGPSSPLTLRAASSFASILRHHEQWDRSEAILNSAMATIEEKYSDPVLVGLRTKIELVELHLAQSKPRIAHSLLKEIEEEWSGRLSDALPSWLTLVRLFARAEAQLQDWETAEQRLQTLVASASRDTRSWRLGYDYVLLALVKSQLGQSEEALAALEMGTEILRESKNHIQEIAKPEIAYLINAWSEVQTTEAMQDAIQSIVE